MKVADFHYDLPERLIARYPARSRTGSRLLILDRSSGQISHRRFPDITGYLKEGDALIVNDSRVFKARLHGVKVKTGGEVEFLCLNRVSDHTWKVLCRPAKRIRIGSRVRFGESGEAVVIEDLQSGERVVQFSEDPLGICEQIGELPLPPYFKRSAEESDLVRYQTVYSKHLGSVAAPTAGLHFTEGLLDRISETGVELVKLTLHVGWGTFRPVTAQEANDHRVEEEWYSVDAKAAAQIRRTRDNGGRMVVVGTTSTRALESWWRDTSGELYASSGLTDLFIYPPYRFNLVDKLVTNFHLPRSSLLMLVSALAGRENILRCYGEAVSRDYRFYSYGDAMLIL
ncbi:MAG: tRNA preQ1(34) S-adenosylmethionine ribosyltransferase-isomerase QueA [candidate division Zixibacteria bacterium]|nr:tRNA preQ1(34) S-adenosylmethionine ribosyltransferase-isomerase QueA [candidate division Zixibacteria bacterium]MBU1471951.1 tRNA preQ1(34) S-adenosylmethionine ribosyltransferase-isomerase QueA [candidate division Zixibacteria bacterium]MBU2626212.1 tRNA preQ1(34) S-adenosylmethionine ribosyltransferase-isomerase QueA [candidate division Zixibacteria bacterium]